MSAHEPDLHHAPDAVLPVRRALVSVADKTGLAELARGLAARGVALVSTGSTAATIRQAGVAVSDVAEVTGFPEILDGRVKTLHPAIHAGLLADRSQEAHLATLAEHGLGVFDLVVANLYRFEEAVAAEADADTAIEHIDIGGPTLVRAAAKNHAHCGVVVRPEAYEDLLAELDAQGGLTADTRRSLAEQAFARVAAYDAAIAGWLHRDQAFPPLLAEARDKQLDLRYGENPHQGAAVYADPQPWGVGSARQLHGKDPSATNLLDADAAWRLVSDLAEPAVAIIKHTNPAGCATADSLAAAYPAALAGDPVSAFGGIVACNRTVDEATAQQVAEVFTEVVIAPGFSDAALAVLQRKRNLRLLEVTRTSAPPGARDVRTVSGGLVVQDADLAPDDPVAWEVPTQAEPDTATLADLRFAWTVCKHTKSNAIVLVRDGAVVGVGAGQMSRVDSVRLAVEKSQGRAEGAVLASDAFFPFRDGPDAALDAGVRALIQPGGSVRDEETVAACDERGAPMVRTGRRHFRH